MHNNKTLENNCINYRRLKGMLKAQHVIKSTARKCGKYYRDNLSSNLKSISMPYSVLLCHDMKCKDCQHYDAINQYLNDTTEACLSAGHSNIPYSSSPINSGRIPGWSEEVEPLRQKSMFWHQIWNNCGRPHTGHVADCMRRTRASYRYAIHRVKKHREQIICNRIAESLLHNSNRNFWSEIRKIRNNKNLDGCTLYSG